MAAAMAAGAEQLSAQSWIKDWALILSREAPRAVDDFRRTSADGENNRMRHIEQMFQIATRSKSDDNREDTRRYQMFLDFLKDNKQLDHQFFTALASRDKDKIQAAILAVETLRNMKTKKDVTENNPVTSVQIPIRDKDGKITGYMTGVPENK